MKRRLMFALVLLLVAVVPSSVSNVSSGLPMEWASGSEIVVMTFNVRNGLVPDVANNWLFRRRLVEKVIRQEAPDIILLQEAELHQLRSIMSDVPGYKVATGKPGNPMYGYPVVLYRADRFLRKGTDRRWFSVAPWIADSISWGNNEPRCLTYAKLNDQFTGNQLIVGSTHLDHLSSESREESIRMLAEWKAHHSSELVILGGDFNLSADSNVLDGLRGDTIAGRIQQNRLADAYSAIHDRNQGTLHGFTGVAKLRMDLILVSNQWEVVDSWVVTTNDHGRYPSDHYPVVSVLKYPKQQLRLAQLPAKFE